MERSGQGFLKKLKSMSDRGAATMIAKEFSSDIPNVSRCDIVTPQGVTVPSALKRLFQKETDHGRG